MQTLDPNTGKETQRPVGALSAEAVKLSRRFRELKEGDVLKYDDIDTIIGQDSRNGGRSCVNTARRQVLRGDDIHIECVAKIGYKRLTPSEATQTGDLAVACIRRKARRASEKLAHVPTASLSKEDNHHLCCAQTVLAIAAQVTSAKSVKLLDGKVTSTGTQLPWKDAILAIG